MNEAPVSRFERVKDHLRRLLAALRKVAPFAATVVVTLAALWIYQRAFPGPRPLTTQDVSNTAAQVMASVTPRPAYSSTVYQVILPSLVAIESQFPTKDGKEQNGIGTGVIMDDAGDILTALHVVANATQIQVTFADGTQSAATIITQQPENDIAVLQAEQLPAQVVPATMGNPNSMRIGDEAYAVGNPFGLYASMSAGIISGFDRTFQSPDNSQELKGLIQIDTAVNPGNSGGPLLNRYGEVIGIVEGIVNPTGEDVFIGIGFAVPISTAGGALGSPPD
jgi:S1-C subfamily serine protease